MGRALEDFHAKLCFNSLNGLTHVDLLVANCKAPRVKLSLSATAAKIAISVSKKVPSSLSRAWN
jgi:hypothetical protein